MGRSSKAMTNYLSATGAYLRNLESDGGSPRTVGNYSSILNLFYEFMLNGGYSEEGPSYNAVADWKSELYQSGTVSPRSMKQYLNTLSWFFDWATDDTMESPYYVKNPVSDRLIPDTRKQESRPYEKLLTDQQILQLIQNNPRKSKRPAFWERNYAIVMTLLFTKIRNAELLALSPADIDFGEETLTVEHGKGDKKRIVDLHSLPLSAIKVYLASGARPDGLSGAAPLFGTMADESGHKCDSNGWHGGTSQWLSGIVARHVAAVTGVDGIRSHALRHAGARLDLNRGISIEELQSQLGHSSVSTTQIYSGKLLTKKERRSTIQVFEEAEYQAKRNESIFSKMPIINA